MLLAEGVGATLPAKQVRKAPGKQTQATSRDSRQSGGGPVVDMYRIFANAEGAQELSKFNEGAAANASDAVAAAVNSNPTNIVLNIDTQYFLRNTPISFSSKTKITVECSNTVTRITAAPKLAAAAGAAAAPFLSDSIISLRDALLDPEFGRGFRDNFAKLLMIRASANLGENGQWRPPHPIHVVFC